MRSFLLSGALLWLASSCVASTGLAKPLPANHKSPLGTNLSRIKDFSPEWAFVDAFKQSRDWISGSGSAWEDERPLDLDAHGWVRSLAPGQVARTLLFWEADGKKNHFPGGNYVVLYEGKGKLEYRRNAKLIASTPGRDVIRVRASGGGIQMTILETDPKDYLRNIRFIMPGGVCSGDPFKWCEDSASCGKGSCQPFEQVYEQQIFHPILLDRIKRFSVFRFMDWMMTNHSRQEKWADRPKLTDARWSTHGVPVEALVELANRLQVDPWFCMPHLADSDYVTRFATYVRDHLARDRRVYIEYSNEVWNSRFSQGRYCAEQGKALHLSDDDFGAHIRFYSRQAVRTFNLWTKVFGDTKRLVRVMGSQASNAWVSKTVLNFEDAYRVTDALAIAPYFGINVGHPRERSRTAQLTVEELLEQLHTTELARTTEWMQRNAAVAKKAGVDLITYEGGQHLAGVGEVANDKAITRLFIEANRSPRMKAIYSDYLRAWKQSGGRLFVHYNNCYNPGRHGSWGSLEYLEQDIKDAPKYDALQQFISENPRWW